MTNRCYYAFPKNRCFLDKYASQFKSVFLCSHPEDLKMIIKLVANMQNFIFVVYAAKIEIFC